jgi:hypothetical protein
MPFLSDYACKMCLQRLSKISLQEARFLLPPSSRHLGISGLLLRRLHFFHSFLIVPETPVPLLGQDLLSWLKAQILLPRRGLSLLPPFSETNRSHSVD